MSKLGKTIAFVAAVTTLSLVVFPVAAQITQVSGGDCSALGIKCSGNETTEDLLNRVRTIVNAFLVLVGITAAIYLVLGGLRYIRSDGDEGQAEQAKNTILYAILGLILIGLSAMIVNFVIGQFTDAPGGGAAGGPQFEQVPISPVQRGF